ncbi:MAG: helix-turn-helix transcriptional regulator [Sphingobacteriaceae bacterium]|nr:helix-turn-helix transcriptional regulator [Sphingobacteriaceae bacterium]
MTQLKNKHITTLDELLDEQYGKPGTEKRDQWEQGFEAFRLGFLLQEARLKLGMSKKELAAKCGTSKSLISSLENNAGELKLSTLMKIIQKGFGGHLKLTLQL